LLWLDEVQTGIGRTGDWFAYARLGINPDLLTLAKGLGGGLPIGAFVALGEAATLLEPGDHGTTFGGNPVATAAALAVIETIEKHDLLEHVRVVGETLRDRLANHPSVQDVTGRGLLMGVVLTEPVAARVQQAALAAGLIVNAPTPNRIRLAPPLILTADEAGAAAVALTATLDEVTNP
jgi:acetylornithine aminotransferase